MFKGRPVTWKSKISQAIQDLYADPAYLAKKAKYKLSPLDRAHKLRLKMYKFNAKTANRVWELTDSHASHLFISACHYCGHEPDLSATKIKLNGIDRMNNSDGYTRFNALSCCWTCNRNKGTMTHFEFMQWVDKVHQHLHRFPLKA